MSTVLVTGAAGTLGRQVLQYLRARNVRARAFVRKAPDDIEGAQPFVGDMRTGAGLREALEGVDAIVHCATFFEPGNITDLQGAWHLLDVAAKIGAPHIVYISIVGIDHSAFSYFQSKLQIERMIEQSGLPHTILRTTQFHEFAFKLIESFEDNQAGVIRVPPGVQFQTIDSGEVAEQLANLALQPASGRAPVMGGPEMLALESMAETYQRVLCKPHKVQVDADDNHFFDAFRGGVMLVPDRAVGRKTWETFLRSR